jgi:hypothetical protein
VIGVDSDQDALVPGKVLTSVLKRIDVSVFKLCTLAATHKPRPPRLMLGLREGAVGLTDFRYSSAVVTAPTIARLDAIKMQREIFREEDRTRVHPIVTHGGTAITIVPADVRGETFVRGATLDAITDAAAKVDRAMQAGALATGADVEIETLPGYFPLLMDRPLGALFRTNALTLVGAGNWAESAVCNACSDAGDLRQIMPMLHPNHGGCAGYNHTVDFWIVDPTQAYLRPAKALAGAVVALLIDNARAGRDVRAQFLPALTRDGYLAAMRALNRTQTFSYRNARSAL